MEKEIMLSDTFYNDFFYRTVSPKILEALNEYGPYDRTLSIECFNGGTIQFVQSNEIDGIDNPEIKSVPIINRIDVPNEVYDLVFIEEKNYATYTQDQIYEWIRKSSARIVAVLGTDSYMHRDKYTIGFNLKTIDLTNTLGESNDIRLKIYQFDESLRIYE
jgi:hypothetical protein